MKRILFIFTMLSLLTTATQAQDDMYFGSSKKKIEKEVSDYGMPRNTYYSGSSRSVDEYNRRGGSSYEYISGDSTMNDVIDFSGGAGVYPDSTADFNLTRRMSRWDGYTPTDAYWQGYDQGRSDEWAANSWHSPWYYSSYYYPWYDSWYDPWYYDRWYWYRDPWYYRHYSYGWGYYGHGYYGGYYSYHYPRHYSGGWAGNRSRGMVAAGTKGHSINRGNVGYSRYGGTSRSSVGRSVSGSSSSRSSVGYGNARSSSTRTSSYGSARSSSSSSVGSSSSSRSSYGGGGTSFGSSRSSSGSGGFSGSRGGGGGRSGGRR